MNVLPEHLRDVQLSVSHQVVYNVMEAGNPIPYIPPWKPWIKGEDDPAH